MTNSDMSQYLDVFLDEGREQLALLEANFLNMERGNHSAEMLQILFRAAHTLKGSSRAMGFLAVGDLTHEMENILDDLRNSKLEVSTPIVNVLLDCLDSLGALIDGIASSGSDTDVPNTDIPTLVSRLSALRTGSQPIVTAPVEAVDETLNCDTSFPLEEHQQAAVDAAVDSGFTVFQVSITLSADCLMKSVRAWMAFGALESIGSLLASDPSEDKLEAEEFDQTFRFLFATNSTVEIIKSALSNVSEVDNCDIRVIAAPIVNGDAEVVLERAPTPEAVPTEPLIKESIVKAAAVKPEAVETADKDKAPSAGKAVTATQTIRVEVSRLDTLLNLVGELVIERAQVHQICVELHNRYPRDEEATQLLETTHRIARVTAELQDQIMKTRMLPIDGVFQRMPRMVRDLAQKTEKDIRFEMSGGETELDRTVLESLGDPLIHLLRNSVDHGIESAADRIAAGKPAQGLVTLSARHEENRIVIQITDDGKGMDPNRLKESAIKKGLISESSSSTMSDRDALNLIFYSGFSTAAVLSDISGRGVGMDIVKSNLEKIGGRIVVESWPGKGSQFTVHLPMTLAIVRAILVQSNGGTYALPLGNVVEMLRLGSAEGEIEQKTLGSLPIINLRGHTIPLANLADLLATRPVATVPEDIQEEACVVVIGLGERQIGICVDELIGEQEVVIKSMGTLLGDIPGLSGATILGDGKVALIVDVTKASDRIKSVEWSKSDTTVVS